MSTWAHEFTKDLLTGCKKKDIQKSRIKVDTVISSPSFHLGGVYELVTMTVKPGMVSQLEHRLLQGLPARLAEDYPPPLAFWYSEFGNTNLGELMNNQFPQWDGTGQMIRIDKLVWHCTAYNNTMWQLSTLELQILQCGQWIAPAFFTKLVTNCYDIEWVEDISMYAPFLLSFLPSPSFLLHCPVSCTPLASWVSGQEGWTQEGAVWVQQRMERDMLVSKGIVYVLT